VDADYFATARLPILEGRAFGDRDDASAPSVAIVNETLARQLWPDQSPVGRSFIVDGDRLEVVGVVPTGKYLFVWEPPRAMPRPAQDSSRATSSRSGRAGLMTEIRRFATSIQGSLFDCGRWMSISAWSKDFWR
jgi:hypothetical protein